MVNDRNWNDVEMIKIKIRKNWYQKFICSMSREQKVKSSKIFEMYK